MCVLLAVFGVLVEGETAVIWVRIEEGEEDADVFQPGVHALTVEGNHGVRGVADDDDGGCVVVRLALYADEREMWIGVERCDEVRGGDEGRDTGEVSVEEGRDGCGVYFEFIEVR